MDKSLSTKKTEKVNDLVEDAKESASTGYDTENQLSNNLITVTLAFVALLATAISTSNVLGSISDMQRILIMSSIVIFSISIFVGLVNYYLNMRFHQKSAKASRKKAQNADNADSSAEISNINRNPVSAQPVRSTKRNNAFVLVQILLLAIGLSLCVTFIGTMLFDTAEKV